MGQKGGRGNPEIADPAVEIPARIRSLTGPSRPVVGTSEIAESFDVTRQAILPHLDELEGREIEAVMVGRTKCWFTKDESGASGGAPPSTDDKRRELDTQPGETSGDRQEESQPYHARDRAYRTALQLAADGVIDDDEVPAVIPLLHGYESGLIALGHTQRIVAVLLAGVMVAMASSIWVGAFSYADRLGSMGVLFAVGILTIMVIRHYWANVYVAWYARRHSSPSREMAEGVLGELPRRSVLALASAVGEGEKA